MCEYCEGELTSKRCIFHGKNIKILECANGRRLTECEINKYPTEKKYGIVISHYGLAMGYFDINYCPMCGRDLRGKSENG